MAGIAVAKEGAVGNPAAARAARRSGHPEEPHAPLSVARPRRHPHDVRRAPPRPTDQPTPSNPHPPALNTATCDYHGTTSPYDADYADFEDALEGPSADLTSIRARLEKHQVGGTSVAIIEAGRVTQVHWYGCRDRKRALRTSSSTLYQAASLSKFVASVGMVHADRVGNLSLDDDLAELAEDFPDSFLADMVDHHFRRDASQYPEDITVRRLLNHTATSTPTASARPRAGTVPTMEDILLGSTTSTAASTAASSRSRPTASPAITGPTPAAATSSPAHPATAEPARPSRTTSALTCSRRPA